MKAKLPAIVATSLILATSGRAADMKAPVYTKAPVIESVYNWTGFYVGAHAGYVWGQTDASAADTAAITATYGRMPRPEGFLGGLHAGYNYQLSTRIVLGVEASVDGFGVNGLKDTLGLPPFSQLNVTTDWAGSLVGRLGYAMGRWLPYVYAGGMWAHDKESGFNPFMGAFALANSHSGVTAGFGAEYAFADRWSARAQYRYIDLDRQKYNARWVGGSGSGVDAGVSYHF